MMSASTLPRAWDAFDAYLFDIDGTLIECTDATHYFAFCDALKSLSGRDLNLEGVIAHGNTDVGILRDALTLAGIQDEVWRERLPEIRTAMGTFVEERKAQLCTTVLPRVELVLKHLRERGAKVGVATGNLEQIGRLKLESAGLLQYFDFGGWSDQYEYRRDVFRGAVQQARALSAKENIAMCVVGDTPADVLAAHDNGLPVIAVATGIFPFEQLMEHKPELCLHSFSDLWIQTK